MVVKVKRTLIVIILLIFFLISARTFVFAANDDESLISYLQSTITQLIEENKKLKQENLELKKKLKEEHSIGYNEGIIATHSYDFISFGSYYYTDQGQINVYLEIGKNDLSVKDIVSFVGSERKAFNVKMTIPDGYFGIIRGEVNNEGKYRCLEPGEYSFNLIGMACIVKETAVKKWWNYFNISTENYEIDFGPLTN